MQLKNIGEFGLIDKLKKRITSDASVVCSIGDDAAVIKYTKDEYLLFAGDMLVEDVHFRIGRDKKIFAKIGHKVLACNISDIASMGGIAKYAVVNLGVRPDLDAEKIYGFFSGMQKTAKRFGVNIVGGDLSKSDKITAAVSIIGVVKKKNLTLRSTAKSHDLIFVTGPLGGSGKGKHLEFTPRLKEAQYLLSKYKINSMIDISDGLVQDLWQILKASRKGAVLYEKLVPVGSAAVNINGALYDGEDFELLFTAGSEAAEKIAADKKIKFYQIGKVLPNSKKIEFVDIKGNKKKLNVKGFSHF